MPDNQTMVQLRDKSTGQPHSVPLSELQLAIDSGQYEQYGGSNVNVNRLGTQVTETPQEAQGTLSTGNEQYINPSIVGAQQSLNTRREAFDTSDDKALTFVEGMVDALSVGMFHEHGDEADIRRDVNSGSALLGQLAGTIGGLEGGFSNPLKTITQGGEETGALLAKRLFGNEGAVAKAASSALRAGIGNATMMAAGAAGHQLSDAVFENKPLAVEAIVHEAGLGFLLGGGVGLLGDGLVSTMRGAGRDAVERAAGIPDVLQQASTHFDSSIGELNNAVSIHENRLGALDGLEQASQEGLIPKDFIEPRKEALQIAQKARDKLAGLGTSEDALNGTPAAARKWVETATEYEKAVNDLDSLMKPRLNEIHQVQPQELGQPLQGPINEANPDLAAESGTTPPGILQVNDIMNNSPWGKAQYKKLFGRDWEAIKPVEPLPGEEVPSSGNAAHEQNLGGVETPTSADVTNPTPRRKVKAEPVLEVKVSKLQKGLPGRSNYDANFSDKVTSSKITDSPEFKQLVNDAASRSGKSEIPNAEAVLPSGASQNARDFYDAMNRDLRPSPAPGDYSDLLEALTPDRNLAKGFAARPGEINMAERASMEHEPIGPDQPKPAYRTEEKPIEEAKRGRVGNLSSEERTGFGAGQEQLGQDLILSKHEKLKKLMSSWFEDSKKTIRSSPGDAASTAIGQSMSDLMDKTSGRLDSAGSLGIAQKFGFKQTDSLLGSRFQQAWALKKTAELASKASRAAKPDPRSLVDLLRNRIGGRLGRIAGGALAGGYVGGDAGSALGVALAAGYGSFTGKIAGSVTMLSNKVADVGEKLLSKSRPVIAARAIAGNRPWAYSDRGPIKDPIERIQEIQHVAAHPDMIENLVHQSAGDLAVVHPELHDKLVKAAVGKIQALSVRAPKFMWDKWGDVIPPPVGAMRKFLEYENAMNDLNGTLTAAQSGTITKDQADGLREGWPQFSGKLSVQLLDDPSRLKNLPASKLESIENITGLSFRRLDDGKFVSRQQIGWSIANDQSKPGSQPSQAPQAFKINTNKVPTTKPTINQSYDGKAPGN